MRHVTLAVPAACEVLVAVAQHDSPEFRRQSQEYSQVSTRWALGHCSRQLSPTCSAGKKSCSAELEQFLAH